MAAIFLSGLALLVASAAIGHALWALGRLGREATPAPAVGLAALLVLARLGMSLPGRATTALALCAAATAAALALPAARAGLRGEGAWRALGGLGVLFAGLVPFLVSGRAGILGMGDNNDMSAHLTTAWWLDTHGVPVPAAATHDPLPTQGYPVGPHALAAAIAQTGVSIVHAFDAVTIIGPVVLALAAGAVLPAGLGRARRAVAAALVGLAYLPASYVAQGAFKEVLLGALLVAFALTLRAAAARAPAAGLRAGLPLGVLAGGCLYVYSVVGLAWPVAAVLAWLVLEGLRTRRLPHRAALAPLVGAAVVAGLLAAAEARPISAFLGSSFAHEPIAGLGNLAHPVFAGQATGIWPVGDYRRDPQPQALWMGLDAAAAIALAWALVWWLRRGETAVVAAVAAAAAMALQSWILRSPYNTAKGLAILGATVALALWPALLGARRPAARAAAAVLAALAAASSFLALRDAPVGPTRDERQLQRFAAIAGPVPVLYLGVDDFGQWSLRGTRVATGPLLYAPAVARPWGRKPWRPPNPLDPDDFPAATLERFAYLVTTGAAYGSRPPAGFRAVARTTDYVLWRRVGPAPPRVPLEPPGQAGAVLECGESPAGGTALVLPRPVAGAAGAWRGQPWTGGDTGALTLRVPRGAWDVSLQYVSSSPLELTTSDGLRVALPARLSRMGSYWPAGVLRQARSGPVTFRVRADGASWFGRLLGAPMRTRALNVESHQPLGRLVLTRRGVPPRRVSLRRACGRYADHVVPATAPTR